MHARTQQARTTRLAVLHNGYAPLPNRDKACYLPAWSSIEIDEAAIDEWSSHHMRYFATGIRVEKGLMVVDLDLDDEAIVDAVMDELDAMLEARGLDFPLVRRGRGAKVALFMRTSEPFGRIATRGFVAPGASADDAVQRLEVFGGAQGRQFGAFGPHTISDVGEVLVTYRWEDDASPSNVPFDELPVVDKSFVFALCDAVERILLDAGWTVYELSKGGESQSHQVYDLEPSFRYDVHEGDEAIDEAALVALVEHGAERQVRVSASWLEGASARNRTRCLVNLSRSGSIQIWDSASGTTHLPRAMEPRDHTPDLARAMETLQRAKDIAESKAMAKLDVDDDMSRCTAKLLMSFAFAGGLQKPVVSLYGSTAPMTMTAFRQWTLPWSEIEIGPKGGEKRINPADLWACAKDRITIEDTMMRPDLEGPVFQLDGRLYVNTYQPPIHDAPGGDAGPGLEFLKRLLPDARERSWFLQWLAYKYLHPAVPGPAVIMVADDFGTGRGTLGELLKRVFGERHAKTIPHKTFTGSSGQGQYTDWMGDSVIVMVNESAEGEAGRSSHQHRNDVYEHLKELVEPRAITRRIIRKGEPNYQSLVCTSFLLFSNNRNGYPIEKSDRRFAVLTNGPRRDQAYWDELNAWMDRPANVAAFVAHLASIDLSDYSPYAVPIDTAAKGTMIDMGASDIDRGFDAAWDAMPGTAFHADHVIALMTQARGVYGYDYPERWEPVAKKLLSKRGYRIGVRNGQNWVPMIDGKRHSVYSKDAETAARWTEADATELGDEIRRSGAEGSREKGAAVFAGLFPK